MPEPMPMVQQIMSVSRCDVVAWQVEVNAYLAEGWRVQATHVIPAYQFVHGNGASEHGYPEFVAVLIREVQRDAPQDT